MLNIAPQEKRQYERIAGTMPVRFRFADRLESVWSQAQALNISEGGIFLAKNLKAEAVGNIVHLDLWLEREGKSLHVICQVAWLKKEKDTVTGVGLEIIQFDQKHKQTYLTYIYQRVEPKKQERRKIKFLSKPLADLADKERRCFQVLDHIRRFGPVTKAEICKEVDINAVSAGKFIDDFLKMGLVFDCGLDLSSGGRRAQLFKLNKDFGLILGIEVNSEAGYMLALVANMAVDIILEDKKQIKNKKNIEAELTNFISSIIAKLAQDASQVLGIGIGLADTQEDKSLQVYLSKKFDLPVVIEEGFHLESYAQMWMVRELHNKSILYIHSKQLLSLILAGDVYKPEKEIEGKVELVSLNLQDKVLTLIELLGPDIIYIAKRVERELPQLKLTLKEKLKKADIRETETIKVLSSDINENKAVALGAVSVVIKEVFVGIF